MKANDSILKNMRTNMTSLTNSNLELKNMVDQFMKMNTASSSGSGTLPGNTITNPKEELKGITTRSDTSYQGPTIPTTSSSLPPLVERETEATKDTPVVAPGSAPKPNQRPSVSYLFRLHDQKLRNKANDQRDKFFQIFKDLNFNISFADALILMLKFGPTIKTLLTNKDKLSELERTPLNEHCSVVLLKRLQEKLGDPDKFLIPFDFPGMAECLALADLDASINLMSLSVWNKLLLPDFSPTCMTIELADRSISRSVGVAEDVFVKVGTFNFLADFVVVDFDADLRVPLILRRYFLKTRRALIDVFEGELSLRVGKKAITFNLDQNSRYSANYNDMTANRINVIDMACEEYSDSDFLLEEVAAFLALDDDPTSPDVDLSYVDTEGDILLIEAFLNDDPSLPPTNQGNYLPQVRNELKFVKLKLINLQLMSLLRLNLTTYLPISNTHFWKVTISCPSLSKDLSVEEKTTLITVLKSHKRAIAWKLFDIKGIDPEFCTHKILMEDDFEPAVQHQRKVNPKIYDVIKNEVLKLLDAGLIYSISDSSWGETSTSVFLMVPRVTFKFPSIQKIKKTPHSRVLTKRLPSVACLFAYAMHRARSKEKMLNRCEDTNLCLNWEKSHFMVKEGIVLSHKMSKNGIVVDKAKVEVIAKLPHPTTVKGIRIFLGHAGFYRRFIKDFSKITQPMTRLFKKDTQFFFSKECVEAFQTHKRKLTEAPILIAPGWDLPFELMYDASDFAIGSVLGKHQEKHFRPIHYASKTITEAKLNYTTTEKEVLAVVYAFEKFQSCLIMNKSIVYTDHFALKYLFAKKDSKARLLPYKTPIGCTPYKLVYGKACHLPIELEHKAYWALKHANFNLQTVGDHIKVQLNELNELFDQAHENSLIYKEKTKRLHDSKIKDRVFNIGDRVLLFNSKLMILSGKLKTRWSGPSTISHAFPYGTVEYPKPRAKFQSEWSHTQTLLCRGHTKGGCP
uniref:Reverse transcriptase domain-containing protein n=1 Tax=Tanacetum cinerariifolium TaxID=118510 RepID=A0A6L2M8W6_TANCI|nr:reverse transcriptase domain-containing protein [Tanacetum cinerariifolium]